MKSSQKLVDRYIALWNEPDPSRRRDQVVSLWSEEGEHLSPSGRHVGHDAIEARVAGTFERFIAARHWRFRVANGTARASNVVRLHWQAVSEEKGAIEAAGIEFLVLGADGRIRFDYHMT